MRRPHPVPEEALTETFLAGSGPGGQNTNKVATTVQLRVDLFRLGLSPYAYRRIRQLAGRRLTSDNEILIIAREYRTREANREAARARLASLIAEANERQERRIATKPGKAAKARRVDAKKKRATVKQGRGKVSFD